MWPMNSNWMKNVWFASARMNALTVWVTLVERHIMIIVILNSSDISLRKGFPEELPRNAEEIEVNRLGLYDSINEMNFRSHQKYALKIVVQKLVSIQHIPGGLVYLFNTTYQDATDISNFIRHMFVSQSAANGAGMVKLIIFLTLLAHISCIGSLAFQRSEHVFETYRIYKLNV